ncbi:MAG: hypothetical protein P4N59_03475 [Negativicutes bacterium]|nr:hypothetical protein [Negativicutes bacterium]
MRKPSKKWSQEDIAILRREWGIGSIKDLAAKLGRDPRNLRSKASALDFPGWRCSDGKDKRINSGRDYAMIHKESPLYKHDTSQRMKNPNWSAFVRLLVLAYQKQHKGMCWSNVIETAIKIVKTGEGEE